MLNNNYEVKTLDCKRSFKELISTPYAITKLFVKRFEVALFCIKYISGILYKFGVYGEKVRTERSQKAIEDLKIIHGDKAIDMINSSVLMATINICQNILLRANGKITLMQLFPVAERNILRYEAHDGQCFKMIAFPLSVGGYVAWNKNKFYAVIPNRVKSNGYNFSTFLPDVMSLNLDSEDYDNNLQKISESYSCSYDMVRIDRINKDVYVRKYQKIKGKYVVGIEVKIDPEEGEDGTRVIIGDFEKSSKDHKDEIFYIEI